MSNLEHLIENCLCNFEKNKSIEQIKTDISNDINLKDAGITKEQCYEICQYVWCTFMTNYRFNKNLEVLNILKKNPDLIIICKKYKTAQQWFSKRKVVAINCTYKELETMFNKVKEWLNNDE